MKAADVSAEDQLRAASDHQLDILREGFGEEGERHSLTTEQRRKLASLLTGDGGSVDVCLHAEVARLRRAPIPLFAHTSVGAVIGCGDCLMSWYLPRAQATSGTDEDYRCDLCSEVWVDGVRPMTLSWQMGKPYRYAGPVTFFFYVCDRCHTRFQGGDA